MFVRLLALLFIATLAPAAYAQLDADVLVLDVDGRLTTGRPNDDFNDWILGARLFAESFVPDESAADQYLINNPGWNTLGAGSPNIPATADSLTASTPLRWDFLPMKIDGVASNLFYWDGSSDVQFGALPSQDYKLYLQSMSDGYIAVDGSENLIPGAVIDDTDTIGRIHKHRDWFLDDGDADLETDPAAGVFLVSIRVKMDGYDRSQPFYLLFDTPGSAPNALAQASQWVDNTLDALAPEFGTEFYGDLALAQDSDFNGDLQVNQADLDAWQTGFGTQGDAALQIAGDANFDSDVDGSDFLVWQRQHGFNLTTFLGASSASSLVSNVVSVPEPTAISLVLAACAVLAKWRRLC